MRKSMTALAGTATAVAAAMGMMAGPASAAPASVQGEAAASADCGWYTDWTATGYYNHCGPTNVMIWVDRVNLAGYKDFEKCVKPGITRLGPWPDFKNAWYLGRTC
ncbi:DUF6355 family natural product biosynthesis protein [Allokutzneria sp. NRRL B-24872]|uniref:DUF6355 family natural product biosynthesis protein n=1 Tax=Allokutzneria sp. NRRL B-24872 TaxID=1137961 RepID=UPI000A3920B3|nr:DUF6355 family natural product biosynthesis protein [Allokutzneria sp. NRRL B-24872]